MDMDLMRRWLALDARKRSLKADLTAVEADLSAIHEAVTAQFADNCVTNISIDGRTVYVACDRWPKVTGSKDALLAAMKENGLGALVKENFNAQSLRGVMNEWLREFEAGLAEGDSVAYAVDDAIPERFRGLLEYSEVYTVKSCKS